MSTPATATKQLTPFRYGTRQRIYSFGSAQIVLGNQVTTELPRVGFLAGIFLDVNAVVTLAGAGALATFGPWSLFKRISVTMNTGQSSIYDTSGYGAFIVNENMLARSFNPLNAASFVAPVAQGANTWRFGLFIPIAMNDEQQFNIGLINLQAPEIRCTLNLTFANAGAEFTTQFQTVTGTVGLSYLYYEVPNPQMVAYPPLAVHRILEDRQAITAVGDQTYVFPRGGTVLELAHVVTLNSIVTTPGINAAVPDLIDSMRLVLNKTDTVYNMPSGVVRQWQLLNKANDVGHCYKWNFLDGSISRMGEGDFRDTIDSEQLSTLESILTVNAGAVIGAAAFVDSIRRVFQVLQ
jgi:hypothetical protein